MQVSVYSYEIPFITPFRLANGAIEQRKGIIFSAKTDHGIYWSEAAPLPGFSKSDFETVRLESIQISKYISYLKDDKPPVFAIDIPVDLMFGLSSLWYAIHLGKEKTPFRKHFEQAALEQVPVNVAIGLGEEHQVLELAKLAIQDGYDTLKIKVGENFDHEIRLLKLLREKYPAVSIRIDANQSWTPEIALEHLKELESLNIQYCEQPVKADEFEGMGWLKKHTSIPIAADESVRSFEDAQKIIKHDLVDILVLKPMLIGPVEAFVGIVNAARRAGMEVVTTTSLETGIGRRIVAQLAATINPSKYAHGLATGNLFSFDPAPDDYLIKNGNYLIYKIRNDYSVDTSRLLLIAES